MKNKSIINLETIDSQSPKKYKCPDGVSGEEIRVKLIFNVL